MSFTKRTRVFQTILKVRIQSNTEVTSSINKHLVNQIYFSALPVSYSQIKPILFETFARFILKAAYEATLYSALRNMDKTGCNKLYLTLVGGGAFGNRIDCILDAISIALSKFESTPLDVQIVGFRGTNKGINEMLKNQ